MQITLGMDDAGTVEKSLLESQKYIETPTRCLICFWTK